MVKAGVGINDNNIYQNPRYCDRPIGGEANGGFAIFILLYICYGLRIVTHEASIIPP